MAGGDPLPKPGESARASRKDDPAVTVVIPVEGKAMKAEAVPAQISALNQRGACAGSARSSWTIPASPRFRRTSASITIGPEKKEALVEKFAEYASMKPVAPQQRGRPPEKK